MKKPDAPAPDSGEKGAERKRFSVCLGCPDARGAHVHYEHDGREVYAAVPSPFEIAALRARVALLERVIAEAPHGASCEFEDEWRNVNGEQVFCGPCNCWKASVR